MTDEKLNRLADETSPYLLQHASNPVQWYPWSDEALRLAQQLDKPILLSIGYSACHWCHVMAHESFENDDIAALMNELFVNIKVDREERPDLDKLYQTAHQLFARRAGGWPLTVFIDPRDKLPFFAGTYFPPVPRHGMPAFPDVLQRVAAFYRDSRAEVTAQKEPLQDVFKKIDATDAARGDLDDAPLRAFRRVHEEIFDSRHGGFGNAPKFPHPGALERLLAHWAASRAATADVRGLHMASFSLESMIRGGLYDQLGGGFYRYSVDERWQIPHFEKMLYDNGPLLAAAASLHRATGQELFGRAAHETAQWLIREMQSPEGGYYATLDADSEGVEGKFYAWSADEVEKTVGADAWPLVSAHFGLDQPPNFEGRHHLYQAKPLALLAEEHSLDVAAVREQTDTARAALLKRRETRVRPGRDEKILTGWNALAIRGMAIAARELDRPHYAVSASRALDFIRDTLWQDNRLLATYKDGRARFNGYLDDYAHLADAIIELLQCRWRSRDLVFAGELAEALLKHFEDRNNGGFFFTADDHERLFHRPRTISDDATPSGNGTATRALLRLGYLLGENRYLDAAERTLRAAWEPMRATAEGHATLISALAEFLEPPEIVILRGTGARLEEGRRQYRREYEPKRLVFAIDSAVNDLPEALAVRAPRGEFVAYLCRGHSCTIATE